MELNVKVIGRRVKELRSQERLSQAALAERIDMSVTYISRIETGKKQASLGALVRIAEALGVTVNNLLYGNQANDKAEYIMELAQLLEDCSSYEKRVIYEIALATKKALIENRGLRRK